MKDPEIFLGALFAVLLLVVGILLGDVIRTSKAERQAAETECARFHPETGEFEWVKNR